MTPLLHCDVVDDIHMIMQVCLVKLVCVCGGGKLIGFDNENQCKALVKIGQRLGIWFISWVDLSNALVCFSWHAGGYLHYWTISVPP